MRRRRIFFVFDFKFAVQDIEIRTASTRKGFWNPGEMTSMGGTFLLHLWVDGWTGDLRVRLLYSSTHTVTPAVAVLFPRLRMLVMQPPMLLNQLV